MQRQPRASLAAWRSLLYDRLTSEILQQRKSEPELDCDGVLVPSVTEALQLAERRPSTLTPEQDFRVHVVVTGSLHLVGAVLYSLDRPVE
jgi:folylpolyglutamate synthase/dihydropteroate synthase